MCLNKKLMKIVVDKTLQVKSENSLEYPFQKNVYPSLSELTASESLMTLQVIHNLFNIILIILFLQ